MYVCACKRRLESILDNSRHLVARIIDGLAHIGGAEQGHADEEEGDEGQQGATRATRHLYGYAKDDGPDPGSAALADLVEAEVGRFLAAGDHLGRTSTGSAPANCPEPAHS